MTDVIIRSLDTNEYFLAKLDDTGEIWGVSVELGYIATAEHAEDPTVPGELPDDDGDWSRFEGLDVEPWTTADEEDEDYIGKPWTIDAFRIVHTFA